MKKTIELFCSVLDPCQADDFRRFIIEKDCSINEALRKAFVSSIEMEFLCNLTMLLLQETLLSLLSTSKDIEELFELCILFSESLGNIQDSASLREALEIYQSTANGLQILLDELPKIGINATIELLGEKKDFKQLLQELAPKTIRRIVYDAAVHAHFPLLRAIDNKNPDSRFIQPIRLLLTAKSPSRETVLMSTSTVWSLAYRYLDLSKPTYLHTTPPPSMLRIHSESTFEGEQLWSRKTLGKAIGLAILLFGMNESASRVIINYFEVSFSVKVKKELPKSTDVIANNMLNQFLVGLLTGLRDYALISPNEGLELTKFIIFADQNDDRIGGLLLALGLMGKLEGMPSVEMLGLVSSGNHLIESCACIALAASNHDHLHLLKLLLININQYSDPAAESLQIDSAVRVASPLALGILLRDTHDPSVSAIVFNHINKRYLQEKPDFDSDNYVLNCGIAIALIGNDGLHEGTIGRLINLVTCPHGEISRWSRAAACFVLARAKQLARHDIRRMTSICSLDHISFEDILLLRTILSCFHEQNTTMDFTDAMLSQLSIRDRLLMVADCLALGLCSLAGETITIPSGLTTAVLFFRKNYKVAALDYSTRYGKHVHGFCHDLLLLAWSMMLAGTGDELVLRNLSDSFGEHLDYCFGRAVIHSMSLALLTVEIEKLKLLRQKSSNIVKICFLACILPLSAFSPDNFSSIFRLFLPFFLLQGYQKGQELHSNPLSDLLKWSEIHAVPRILSELLTTHPPPIGSLEDLVVYLKIQGKFH